MGALVKRHCCYIGCVAAASFEIIHMTGHPEDATDSCLEHVGDLLGSITDVPWGTYPIEIHPLVSPEGDRAALLTPSPSLTAGEGPS